MENIFIKIERRQTGEVFHLRRDTRGVGRFQ
jgi:hypothetical protein